MTLKEFKELYQKARRYAFKEVDCGYQGIRLLKRGKNNKGVYYCPITAVCEMQTKRLYFAAYAYSAARDMGLNLSVADKIIMAADSGNKEFFNL